MTFKELGLNERVLKALSDAKYTIPTPIQEQAIPHILEKKDLLGCAQTGTGKTAAFALPIINNLVNSQDKIFMRKVKVLILTPTRELAIQIRDNFRQYGMYTNLKCGVILGGVNQRSQVQVLKKGVDIIVATPGRLLDLINQKYIKLEDVNTLVLDEADTMLDMGFIKDVNKIISYLPKTRQTLFFSATMPKEISDLANTILTNYVTVRVNPVASIVPLIDQAVYYVDRENKSKLLLELLNNNDIKSALIFSRTKHGANKLSETLYNKGIDCSVIHGNKSQSARALALKNFKLGKVKFLIATDIAARGIDISGLSHVINYEMPDQAETYIHRIGRTGRAGLTGVAISLCDYSEIVSLLSIERLIKKEILVISNHNYPMIKKDVKVGNKRNNNFKSKNNNNKIEGNSNKKKYNYSKSNKSFNKRSYK